MSNVDWRKMASDVVKSAATAAQSDESAVERAFADQAYQAVARKAGPLMGDQHLIGFENVYSNDDSTRMVGTFGFKSGKEIYLAPVFFVNSEIRGADLLYIHSIKQMRPLTKEWSNYLISKSDSDMGSNYPKADTAKIRDTMDTSVIAYGGQSKLASAMPDFSNAWDEMCKRASTAKVASNLDMKEVLGALGTEALDTLISWCEKSAAFADSLERFVGEDVWAAEDTYAPHIKVASAPEPWFVSVNPQRSSDLEWFARGFTMEDTRPMEKCAMLYETADNQELSSVAEPGLWDVLRSDGSFKRTLVFNYDADSKLDPIAKQDSDYYMDEHDLTLNSRRSLTRRTTPRVVLVDFDGASNDVPSGVVFGGNHLPLRTSERILDSMATGKCYRMVDLSSQSAGDSFYVVSKTVRSDGVEDYMVARYPESMPQPLTRNPHLNKSAGDVVGSDIRFVEVGADTSDNGNSIKYLRNLRLGSQAVVTQWALDNSDNAIKGLRIKSARNGAYTLTFGSTTRACEDSKKLAHTLLADLGIHVSGVRSLLSKLDTSDEVSVAWESPEIAKYASTRVRIADRENFRNYTDNSTGMIVEPAQRAILRTDWQRPDVPGNRFGDAWDPAMGKKVQNGMSVQVLISTPPTEIARLATESSMPSVFEHGVVGNLVKTMDAAPLIDSYIPKLEDAVDALGRTMFLFLWKPSDFEALFGVDDMQRMDAGISGSFRVLGNLLLDLLVRVKEGPRENVSKLQA